LGCLGQGGATAQDAKTAAGAVSDNCTASGSIVVTAVGGAITGECHKTQDWTVTAKDGCNNTKVRVVTLNGHLMIRILYLKIVQQLLLT
jgi:hypothetical protein